MPVASFSSAMDLVAPVRCAGCGSIGLRLCPDCARVRRFERAASPIARVDRVLAVWDYEGAPRELILALKLRADRSAAGPLADGIAETLVAEGIPPSVVTWVPGRRRDARRRGFDHAALLARHVATRLGLPASSLLVRTGSPPDQTSLSVAQRWASSRHAFRARPSPPAIVIVDDLVTTGSTAHACASAVRLAGATRVDVAVACRA